MVFICNTRSLYKQGAYGRAVPSCLKSKESSGLDYWDLWQFFAKYASVIYSDVSSFQVYMVIFHFQLMCMRNHWNKYIFAKKVLRKSRYRSREEVKKFPVKVKVLPRAQWRIGWRLSPFLYPLATRLTMQWKLQCGDGPLVAPLV